MDFDPLARESVVRALAVGLVLTLAQIAVVCALADAPSWQGRYLAMFQWDGGWYAHIAEHGYRTTIPPTPHNADASNIAFFPGYPLFGRIVHEVSGLSTPTSLLVAAQLASWMFWTYALLMVDRFTPSRSMAWAAILAILLHPGSFFMVVAYSESLFIATLVGFIYWCERPGACAAVLATGHGFVMTATRIVGLGAVPYPLLGAGRDVRAVFTAVAIAAAAGFGVVSFFLFCQWKWGAWNLYFETSRLGWNIDADNLAFLKWRSYFTTSRAALDLGRNYFWVDNDTWAVSFVASPATLLELMTLVIAEAWAGRRTNPAGRILRVRLYLVAFLLFVLTVNARARMGMAGMARYATPVHILVVLAGTHLLAELGFRPRSRVQYLALVAVAAVVGLVLLATELVLARRFVHAMWAA